MTYNHFKSPRCGFTLVELLVVIGIIALLIGILLPTLSRARQSANNVACLSNQRQLGQSIAFFSNEHDGWIPKGWFNDYPTPEEFAAYVRSERNVDWGYRPDLWGWDYVLKSEGELPDDVFKCPADTDEVMRGMWNDSMSFNFPNQNPASKFPDQPTQEERLADNIPASYRYNISNMLAEYRAAKLTDLGNATSAIIIADGKASGYHHLNTQTPYNLPDQAPIGAGRDQIANAAPYRHTSGNIFRGSGENAVPVFTFNASFADGHGESVTWEESFTPTGGPVEFIVGDGNPRRVGERVIGIPTMWRQAFIDGSRVDIFDNPFTDADDGNPRP